MFDRSIERRDARFQPVRLLVLAFTIAFCAPMVFSQNIQKSDPRSSRGLIRNLPQAFQGYTIVSPLRSTNTFLVDMKGEVVHTWKGGYTPTFGVYLLDNGNLLRAGHDPNNFYYREGGQGGIIQEISWDGTVVWEYKYSDRHHAQHHDIEPLPNGNVLLLAWEKKTGHQALIAGRDPKMITADGLWPEHLVEVRPIKPNGGEIVWEWHVWDHLIQDRDPKLRFFGKPEEHPERIYINGDFGRRRDSEEEIAQLRALGYITDSPPAGGQPTLDPNRNNDWNHANSISYNPELDQIAISVLRFSEIWVIDHSTTTEEAAGRSGGNSGKGGDLLYRWGNPQTYLGPGFAEQQQLFSQHDVRWIPDGLPGAGNLTVFNNGRGRFDGAYSSIDEIRLPKNSRRGYGAKDAKLPADAEFVWSFSGSAGERFYSSHISGTERLPNGNTLICVGIQGRVFEVTPQGKTVWDYLNPISEETSSSLPPWLTSSNPRAPRQIEPYGLLRASRVGRNHPGLERLAK